MSRREWSAADDARLRQLYPCTPTHELPALLGRSSLAIKCRAQALHLRKARAVSMRRRWTPAEDAQLCALFADRPTRDVARALGRTESATNNRAQKLGLAKSEAYLTSPTSGRLLKGMRRSPGTEFPKGHVPANKGLRRPGWAPGRMAETQFRKGERRGCAVKLYQPIGAERVSKDGYRERKVNDDLPLQRRWRAVHLLVWEAEHGPLPAGHAVTFRNGDKTDIRLENLELIRRRELMTRNSVHNLPKPIAEAVQLLGALNRKINRRIRQHEEQDRGPAQPPLRDARGVAGPGEADGHRARKGDRGSVAHDHRLGESGDCVPGGDRADAGDRLHPDGGADAAATQRRRRRRTCVAPNGVTAEVAA